MTDPVTYGLDYLRGWAESPVTDDETRGNLRESIAAIEGLVRAVDDVWTSPKPALLAALVTGATWRFDSSSTDFADNVSTQDVVTALGWVCNSCRPDTGWEKSGTLSREHRDDGGYAYMFRVECGHCGSDWLYDETGEEVDYS